MLVIVFVVTASILARRAWLSNRGMKRIYIQKVQVEREKSDIAKQASDAKQFNLNQTVLENMVQKKGDEAKELESMVRRKGNELKELREKIKKSQHTEQELMAINEAMANESKARKDDLHEVIVPGEHVKIENVIGKGGFGVVNVGTYTNKARSVTTPVAIKQLQQFDEEVSTRC